MGNRTEDSAMTNLRGLLDLEKQRVDQEDRSRTEAECERARLVAEARARSDEAARQRALAAEAARVESAELRRLADERAESERMASELRVRLEVDQRARAEAQAANLAHLERMASLEVAAHKGRGISVNAAVALVGLVAALVVGGGLVLRAQANARAEIAAMQRPAARAPSSAGLTDNSDLRWQLAEAQARTRAARDSLAALHQNTPSQTVSVAPRPLRGTGTLTARPRPGTPVAGAYDHLLEGGTDPITDTGLEGGGARRRHR